MKTAIVALTSMCLICACGTATDDANTLNPVQQDALFSLENGPGTRLPIARADLQAAREALLEARHGPVLEPGRGQFCRVEMVQPTVQGSIHYVPALRVVDTAPGAEVRSGYYRASNGLEVQSRGIVEFYVPGTVSRAILEFRERRGWTDAPRASDTHAIVAYPGNLEFDAQDYFEPGVLVGRFVSDLNLEPSGGNLYDLTKAVAQTGDKLGLRFQLEEGVGASTAFTEFALEVSRCRDLTQGAQ